MDGRQAIHKALADAGHHSASDHDGFERHMREKELEAKDRQFQHEQGMKQRAHHIKITNMQELLQAQQGARVLEYHAKHGDAAIHALAKGMVQQHGAEHVLGMAKHLHEMGATATAGVLAHHAKHLG